MKIKWENTKYIKYQICLYKRREASRLGNESKQHLLVVTRRISLFKQLLNQLDSISWKNYNLMVCCKKYVWIKILFISLFICSFKQLSNNINWDKNTRAYNLKKKFSLHYNLPTRRLLNPNNPLLQKTFFTLEWQECKITYSSQ